MFHQIVEELKLYINGRISVRELESWLIVNLQLVLSSNDMAAMQLANNVDADIMELGEELIGEDTFLERVGAYLNSAETVSLENSDAQYTSGNRIGTSSLTIKKWVEEWGAVVDHRFQGVFA